jgi:hypothetical protein
MSDAATLQRATLAARQLARWQSLEGDDRLLDAKDDATGAAPATAAPRIRSTHGAEWTGEAWSAGAESAARRVHDRKAARNCPPI